MRIADFSIKHPVIITIIVIALVVFGGLSLTTMRQDLLAEAALPTVIVVTRYPGVGPESMERDVTDVLEKELFTLSGVTNLSSVSENSVSIITVQFDWEIDLDEKTADIREKINNALPDLPEGITGDPSIIRMSSTQVPIYSVIVESTIDPEDLSRFLEETVIPGLSRIKGVAEVNLQGAPETHVEINLETSQLDAKRISVLEVYEALQYQNINLPAGTAELHQKEFTLRTQGEYTSIEELRNVVIGFHDTAYIRLRDVADIRITEKEPDKIMSSGNRDIIVIDVVKQQGEDTKRIIQEAEKYLSRIGDDYTGLISFLPIADQSGDIDLAISSVKNSAIIGGILAVVILLFFLHRFRTTLIAGISIPLSVIIAMITMNLKGLSLNLISLGGLTVAIGMMVDSSIVVLENIHRNFLISGDRISAASIGTHEVGGAVIASTTTSISVFFPLLFVSGLAGIILEDAAYTMLFALSASLISAVIIVPLLSSKLLKERAIEQQPYGFSGIENKIEGFLAKLEGIYLRALKWSISNRRFMVITAVLLLLVSIGALDFIGFSFIPSTDMNEFHIEFEMPEGYNLEETHQKVKSIDTIIRAEIPELESILYYIGQSGSIGLNTSPTNAFARVRLREVKERKRSVFKIMEVLQKKIDSSVPDCNATIVNGGLDAYVAIASGGRGFIIEISGSDLDTIIHSAKLVQGLMEQDPDIYKTEMNIDADRQEIVNILDLDIMNSLGISPYEAASAGRILFNGINVGTYRGDGESRTIFLTSDLAGEEITRDVLNRLSLKNREGSLISFGNFADLTMEPGVSSIHRENKMKSIQVTGYLRGSDIRAVSSRMKDSLRNVTFPVGIEWEISGSAAEMVSSFTSMLYALIIAVFLVYMVMVIQFERFTQPLIVMASVPFTVIGVVAGLLVFGSTLSIVSFMGLITLSGIVVNNAIVMIDYMNLLRGRDSLSISNAVIEGARLRLKPILMTTLTTVLGILPMAMGIGEGAEVYAPLGQAIAGGLLTSTFITLFLVPILYFILENRLENRIEKRTIGEQI